MSDKPQKLPRAAIKGSHTKMVKAGTKLTRLGLAGYNATKEIKSQQEILKGVNQKIVDLMDPGYTLILDGLVQIPVAEREGFILDNPEAIRSILGERFDDLVDERTSYTATPKLKELVADDDSELAKALRPHTKVTTSVSVSYRGGKALPPGVLPKAGHDCIKGAA